MAPKADPAYGKYLSGYTLDKVLLLVSFIFFTQNPYVKSLLTGERSFTTVALGYKDYFTHMMNGAMDPATRKDALQPAFDYFFGSYLGDNARPVQYEFQALNHWKNSLLIPASYLDQIPHTLAIYLRNYIAINLVYFGIGALWSFVIYYLFVDRFFPKNPKTGERGMPTAEAIRMQMIVSMKSFPLYAMMPTIAEWVVERGWTRAYMRIEEVGGLDNYMILSCFYLFLVEFGIYWVHRLLHDIRPAYKWLHYDHHIYNNQNDMSPFAGLAFNPIDGCLQASPYVVFMFVVPMHFWTHEILMFFTGIWTASIHDAMEPGTEPIMGSKYHLYHHTSYKDNYGQFFVFFDWVHGTLTDPLDREELSLADQEKEKKKKVKST